MYKELECTNCGTTVKKVDASTTSVICHLCTHDIINTLSNKRKRKKKDTN